MKYAMLVLTLVASVVNAADIGRIKNEAGGEIVLTVLALSLVRSICDGMAPTRMYKRGCDLHGNGFACSEIHQRGYLKTGDVK